METNRKACNKLDCISSMNRVHSNTTQPILPPTNNHLNRSISFSSTEVDDSERGSDRFKVDNNCFSKNQVDMTSTFEYLQSWLNSQNHPIQSNHLVSSNDIQIGQNQTECYLFTNTEINQNKPDLASAPDIMNELKVRAIGSASMCCLSPTQTIQTDFSLPKNSNIETTFDNSTGLFNILLLAYLKFFIRFYLILFYLMIYVGMYAN